MNKDEYILDEISEIKIIHRKFKPHPLRKFSENLFEPLRLIAFILFGCAMVMPVSFGLDDSYALLFVISMIIPVCLIQINFWIQDKFLQDIYLGEEEWNMKSK